MHLLVHLIQLEEYTRRMVTESAICADCHSFYVQNEIINFYQCYFGMYFFTQLLLILRLQDLPDTKKVSCCTNAILRFYAQSYK
jgi:hypothetical protein